MTEGRCDVNISKVRETVGDDGQWLDKFSDTCSLDAGHQGEHVFDSPDDDEHLRFDEATKQLGSYRDAPPEGAPPVFKLEPVEAADAS
jgi:hypothetical protein